MVPISLPTIRGWGNLSGPYEAPSAYLPRIAWASPFFPRRVRHDVPDKSRFLVRPRLLTRFSALPMVHRRNGANIV